VKIVEANPPNSSFGEALVEVSDFDVIHVYAATLLACTIQPKPAITEEYPFRNPAFTTRSNRPAFCASSTGVRP
jgi:hypothetical protein